MIRVGVIGCGAIGRPVARTLLRGEAGSHALAGVLARSVRELDGFPVTADAAAFLAESHDLVIEAGGPDAFRALVPAALERSEVWAVSPIPLADPALEREVRRISSASGHALRIAPGAFAGFDGIAAAMAAGIERLDVFVDLAAGDGLEPEVLFEGTARAVALRFPEGSTSRSPPRWPVRASTPRTCASCGPRTEPVVARWDLPCAPRRASSR